ncbi:MAG: InlB B-repeat-containing protein [Spirochaetales bacterium]|nr:InlB B-repeat-containing protein [Spirochaetales bacterium]
MKPQPLKSIIAAVTLLGIILILSVSCMSALPLGDGETVTVRYFSEGSEIASQVLSAKDRLEIPKAPVREGYKFNGWWVTCDEGVVEFDRKWLAENLDGSDVIVNARWLNTSYTIEQLDISFPTISSTIQDGLVCNGMLFKFNSDGMCYIFDLSSGKKVGALMLNGTDSYLPHCNAVCFGSTYYEEGDEFPLLYANIYNSYNKDNYEDKRAGMVCVYRLRRTSETRFSTTLVQVIRIDFAEFSPWRSKWDAEAQAFTDRSPWGNFIIDTDSNKLWAFVTRDANHTTRFFCFDIPAVNKDSLEVVKLGTGDVQRTFDIPYSWYLQGACYHDGKIYSTEGMGTEANPTRIRVVDLENGIEDSVIDLFADQSKGSGAREAEFIDFADGVCYYGDYKKINNSPTVYLYRITGI